MAANVTMVEVLQKIDMEHLAGNFYNQHISPDIVCLLSFHEMQQLGIGSKEDMIRLRNECVKHGSTLPQKVNQGCGPPQYSIPASILTNLINEGFLIRDIAKLLSVLQKDGSI